MFLSRCTSAARCTAHLDDIWSWSETGGLLQLPWEHTIFKNCAEYWLVRPYFLLDKSNVKWTKVNKLSIVDVVALSAFCWCIKKNNTVFWGLQRQVRILSLGDCWGIWIINHGWHYTGAPINHRIEFFLCSSFRIDSLLYVKLPFLVGYRALKQEEFMTSEMELLGGQGAKNEGCWRSEVIPLYEKQMS